MSLVATNGRVSNQSPNNTQVVVQMATQQEIACPPHVFKFVYILVGATTAERSVQRETEDTREPQAILHRALRHGTRYLTVVSTRHRCEESV